MKIPFNLPLIDNEDISAVTQVMRIGNIGGNGPIGREVERLLEKLHGVKYALLTTSCTHALETAIRILELSPGDEIICPSFSFPSAANAVLLCGLRVIFADICPTTLNIDPEDAERKITKKTRAILVVHYGGVACQMERILDLAKIHRLTVIEDAAQCIGASYRSKALSSIGDLGCLSFHVTKNVTCGEGGALLTDNIEYYKKAEIVREKGTNRSIYLKGEIDKYSWVGIGSSYVLSDLQAALLKTQLFRMNEINKAREAIYKKYVAGLSDLVENGSIRIGLVPEGCQPNYHIFFLLCERINRDDCLVRCRKAGVEVTTHFFPLHLSKMGARLGYHPGDFPVTEDIFHKILRLPLYPGLTEDQVEYILQTIRGIFI